MKAKAVVKRGLFFYGWFIVSMAFLGGFFYAGVGMFAFGLFVKPMGEELGWTRAMMAGAVTIRTITVAFSEMVVGPLLDRYGPRLIMVGGAALAGAALIVIGSVDTLWQFYLFFGVLGALGTAGIGELLTNTAVTKWFVRKRGRALAFATIGMSFGGMVLTPLTERLISDFGWRTAWVILGVMLWVFIIVPAALLMKRSPEDIGLLPDGEVVMPDGGDASGQSRRAPVVEEVWTLGAAVRTPTLWLLLIAFNLAGLAISALQVHRIPYMTDKGFSSATAAMVLTTAAFFMIIAKLLWGFLAEKLNVRYCAVAFFIASALGLSILIAARSVVELFLFAVVGGLSGAFPLLLPLVWASYFGRTFLGTIRGVLSPISLIATAGGPLFAGLIYDAIGSYQLAFIILVICWLVGACFMFLARPPKARVASESPIVSYPPRGRDLP